MIKNKKSNILLVTCLILFLSVVILPFNVAAAKNNLNVNLKCPSKIEKGTTIVCDMYAISNKKLDGIQADIILSKNVKLNSFTPNEKLNGGFNNNRLIYLGEWSSKIKIGSLNLSIDKNAKDLNIDIVNISSANLSNFEVEKSDDYSFQYKFPNSKTLIIVSLLILIPIALIVAIVILIKKKKGENKNEKM